MSTTVAVKVQVDPLELASVARSETVTEVPAPLIVVPEGGLWVTVGGLLQLSLAVACEVKSARLASQLASAVSVWLPGQLIVGGELSIRFTVNVHVAVLLDASVEDMVTVVAPAPVRTVPEEGDWLTDGEAVQLSDVLTCPVKFGRTVEQLASN